jgi:DNA-binding MarR family transcriptional regulator
MSSVSSDSADAGRLSGRRRVLANAVRDQLRATNRQLFVLNRVIGGRLKLRDTDLDCLDLVARLGPIGPSELARRVGLHPATMTGILDRLERAGWIVRERDPGAADRRGVAVRARRERFGDVYRQYAGMMAALAEICSSYSERDLELIAEFLERVDDAGRRAVDELAGDEVPKG